MAEKPAFDPRIHLVSPSVPTGTSATNNVQRRNNLVSLPNPSRACPIMNKPQHRQHTLPSIGSVSKNKRASKQVEGNTIRQTDLIKDEINAVPREQISLPNEEKSHKQQSLIYDDWVEQELRKLNKSTADAVVTQGKSNTLSQMDVSTDDDEEIARKIQAELDGEQRKKEQQPSPYPQTNDFDFANRLQAELDDPDQITSEVETDFEIAQIVDRNEKYYKRKTSDDFELAKQLEAELEYEDQLKQENFLRELQVGDSSLHPTITNNIDTDESLALARRLDIEENDRLLAEQMIRRGSGIFGQNNTSAHDINDDDLQLALTMQSLEVELIDNLTPSAGDIKKVKDMQEEEDEITARRLSDQFGVYESNDDAGCTFVPNAAPVPRQDALSGLHEPRTSIGQNQHHPVSNQSQLHEAIPRNNDGMKKYVHNSGQTGNNDHYTPRVNTGTSVQIKDKRKSKFSGKLSTLFRRGKEDKNDERKTQITQTPLFGHKCDACGNKLSHYLSALGKKYHDHCFRCNACHELIDPSKPFAYTTTSDKDRHPLHRNCHATLFGIKCSVCTKPIPYADDGTISYVKHPFFPEEQMCLEHAMNPGRRCTGCHRFEPLVEGFAELNDGDRCVCYSCCRTVVVDGKDAKPLWDKVIYFLEKILGLPIWEGMRNIPVLVVGYETLNERSQASAHSGSAQIMTRGLCLTEHNKGEKIMVQSKTFDSSRKSFVSRHSTTQEEQEYSFFEVPGATNITTNTEVTAILCLSGLPADLSASVLAHEATHAWFKLHPGYNVRKPIPLKVEEGCCQLIALLFLQQGLDEANSDLNDGVSNHRLRQYFMYSIETDENEIYGAGFREAAQAHSHFGLGALFNHISLYREFPQVRPS